MRSAMPLLLVGVPALAGCQKEAGSDDIVAALRACGVERARIERRIPDGTRSDFQVDFGTTASGRKHAECMNARLRAAGLKSVLSFSQDPG